MSTVLPRSPANPRPGLPTYEEPSVARFLVVPGSDSGFLIPDGQHIANDRHIQDLDAPGLVPGLPAVLYFRTQYTAGARFSVRINASSEFHFRADKAGAQSWHELISPGVLREQGNEMVLFVASDAGGQVIFSEIAILYTSNKLTVTRSIVLDPSP
ncbi:hypothetical protein [Luteimonas terricola]|uniref:Uncharacterized protein n=1 Tax=Luteimonas terricola TaxID=645597 RepID=A0ABQ2EPS0_9GAMM|nr:hypothetical protein [Luteimonas terricola]GGK16657.1 hypothetical protein GCM10011394_27340 [Luteimonas terricola]